MTPSEAALDDDDAGDDGDGCDRHRFYRKGIAGDWQNHFTDEHKTVFKQLAGDMLVALGYERDLRW